MKLKALLIFSLFLILSNAELGQLLKAIIENIGLELSSIQLTELESLPFKTSISSFGVTGATINNIRNNVDYVVTEDYYELTILLPNPNISVEINNGYFNPELHVSNLQLIVSLSKDLQKCTDLQISLEKVSIEAGLFSSFIPSKFYNNSYITVLIQSFIPALKEKITQALRQLPFTLLVDKGVIKVPVGKLISKVQLLHNDL